MNKQIILLPAIFITMLIAINCFYVVDQRQQALVFQFGEVVRVIKKPGLHAKLPIIQKVAYFDNRILNGTAEDKEVIAKDQKRLIVNAFMKYKIDDPLKFYQTVRDELGVRSRLNPIFDSSLRQVLGEVPLSALLTSERSFIMKKIGQLVNNQALSFGINVIDVRILRADLPKENSNAIFKRMQTDREKEAKEFRAEGAEEAQIIKSKADKDRKIIIADAEREAEIIRGEGDQIAAKKYATAYNQDPEFFDLYRSLQAYKNSFNNKTKFLLSPNSEFLKYFSKLE